jgi:predicted RecA/RadA family phage recombinase
MSPPRAELFTTSMFQLPRASAVVLTVSARVVWDNTAKEVTARAAGRFPGAVAVETAGNGLTSSAVRLDGVAPAAA